jgi:hypothetical protein
MIPIVSNFTARLSFFAKVGAFSGAIVGSFFLILQLLTASMSWQDVFSAGLMFSLFAWFCVLVFFGVWLRYTMQQILLQTFIVVALTGFATVAVLHIWPTNFAGLVGFILGLVIGALLTYLCIRIFGKKAVKA